MWWQPETEDERRLANTLPRLERRFLEEQLRGIVLGVGSLFSERGLLPLLLVNHGLVSARVVFSPVSITDRELVPARLRDYLISWELPSDALLLPVTPPEPLAAPQPVVSTGRVIRCQVTHARATIGIALAHHGSKISPRHFLTVGHFASPGLGSTVELVKNRGFYFTQYVPIGNVVQQIDPIRTPGIPAYDYAIVQLISSLPILSPPHNGIAQIRSPLPQPILATLYGGVSGIVPSAALCGTLNAYGTPAVWKNSWIVVPSGVISQGDSGGILVLNSTQAVAGMVVGGSRKPNSTVYMVQYAHDMESIEQDILQPAGFSLA
jgi:hypothetical protein